jgi:hypothetical protein
MKRFTIFIVLIFFLQFSNTYAGGISKSLLQMEDLLKSCKQINADSSACYRNYLGQIDSMMTVVFEIAKEQVPINEKSSLLQDQMRWNKKKTEFFKIQEDTFKSNISDGTWNKEMIRITYQQKADFVIKRIKSLLKKIRD